MHLQRWRTASQQQRQPPLHQGVRHSTQSHWSNVSAIHSLTPQNKVSTGLTFRNTAASCSAVFCEIHARRKTNNSITLHQNTCHIPIIIIIIIAIIIIVVMVKNPFPIPTTFQFITHSTEQLLNFANVNIQTVWYAWYATSIRGEFLLQIICYNSNKSNSTSMTTRILHNTMTLQPLTFLHLNIRPIPLYRLQTSLPALHQHHSLKVTSSRVSVSHWHHGLQLTEENVAFFHIANGWWKRLGYELQCEKLKSNKKSKTSTRLQRVTTSNLSIVKRLIQELNNGIKNSASSYKKGTAFGWYESRSTQTETRMPLLQIRNPTVLWWESNVSY